MTFRRLFAHTRPNSQIFRFVAVGMINTGFSYGVYAYFIFLGFDYALANLLALLLGILFSFKTQGRFVFRNSDNRLFGRFLIGWAVIYLATITLIGQFIALGLNAYVSGALALPFSTTLSYLLQKYFVFQTPQSPSHSLQNPNREK
jgi:putative flippase GtrA